MNKNVTHHQTLYYLISTLDVSTYLDIEWEEEETEKCEVSFKKHCETLNKTVSKNFINFWIIFRVKISRIFWIIFLMKTVFTIDFFLLNIVI